MPHQFDNQDAPQTTASLRSQRMTADEAKAVIDLWQQERDEQTGLTDRPAVPDVAEGLNIGVEDVQRLLGEVRERRAEEERALAYEAELAEIRLAEEHRKLAEEERKVSEVRRQRAELRRQRPEGRKYVRSRPPRMEAEPLPWERAKTLLQTEAETFHWTEEDFLAYEELAQEEAEEVPRQAYHSESLAIAYALGGILLMFLLFAGLIACLRP